MPPPNPGPVGAFLANLITGFENLISRILGRITGKAADQIVSTGHAHADDLAVVRSLWSTDLDGQVMPALTGIWATSAGRTAEGLSSLEAEIAALTAPDPADYLLGARNRLVGIGDIVWDDVRTELAAGVEAGEDIPQLAARVRAAAGVAEPRSLVIARTEVVSAHNAASLAQARMIDDPTMIKEWLATGDDRTRETHREADGQRVKIGERFQVGEAELDFPGDPTGPPDEVINCFVAGTSVEVAGLETAYRRWYVGNVVRVALSNGDVLTGTPNHPVLAMTGWVPLGTLREGDDLVGGRLAQEVAFGDPDVDHVPTGIDQIFDSLAGDRPTHGAVGRDMDFHGDGVADSEVQVVRADRELGSGLNSTGGEPAREQHLPSADLLERCLFSGGLPGGQGRALGSAPDGGMGRFGIGAMLLRRPGSNEDTVGVRPASDWCTGFDEPAVDGSPAQVVDARQLCLGDSGQVGGGQDVNDGVGVGQTPVFAGAGPVLGGVDTRVFQSEPDCRRRDPDRIGDGFEGFAFGAQSHKVISVERDRFCGHVYNLQSSNGWYIANGVIVRNCRCSLAVDLDDAPTTASAYDEAHHVNRGEHGKFAHEPGLVPVSEVGTLLQRGPGGGGLSAWTHSVLDLESGPVTVGAALDGQDERHVTIAFGEGNDQAHTSLSDLTAEKFAMRLFDVSDKEEGLVAGRPGPSYADYPPGDKHALPTGFAEVKRTGDDEYQVGVLHGETPLTLTGAETRTLAAEIYRYSTASKVDTAAGQFTSIRDRQGRIDTTWPATAGKPINLNLSVNDGTRIESAIGDLVGAIDEFPVDAHGNAKLGPDDKVATKKIKLGNTVLQITSFGQYEQGGYLTFESSAHDWTLKLPALDAEHLMSLGLSNALADNAVVASMLRKLHPDTTAGNGGSLMGTDMHMPGQHDQLAHGHRTAGTPAASPELASDTAPPGAPDPAPAADAVPEHTGAMIALIPSDADAQRLAVDGGEPPEELHCTLAYLGDDATQIPADVQAAIIAGLTECLTGWPLVDADGFAVSLFNPGDANDKEPCIALSLGGVDLQHVHGIVEEVLVGVVDDASDTAEGDGLDETDDAGTPVGQDPDVSGWEPPEQHMPWIPHVTLTWQVDPAQIASYVDRVGPITFDRVRVAFAGDNTDIPLSPEPDMPGDGVPDNTGTPAPAVAAAGVDFVSRMPEVLKRYWIRHLAPWGHGTFVRCVRALRRYYPRNPEGTCANLHKEATGRWPGRKNSSTSTGGTDMAGTPAPTPVATPGQGPDDSECPDGQHRDDNGDCVPDEPVIPTPATVPVESFDGATPAAPGIPAKPSGPASPDAPPDDACPDGQHPDDGGNCVPDEPPATAGVEHFHAVMHIEGVSTGMRTFVPGALTWRTPPFAFHWQRNSSAHGGLPETVQVGNVLRAERDATNNNMIHGWGNIDLDSPEGLDYARRLANGFCRWVSIGLDESPVEVEFVWPEESEDVDDESGLDVLFMEPEQEIYHSGQIGELTSVSVPAQAEATVEPTPALLEELAARGVVMVAAAVAAHDTATADDSWDGGAAEKALPDPLPVKTARAEYAWVDDSAIDGDTVTKGGCKFPHHEVGADGQPGAANLAACSAVIASLHGGRGEPDIPDPDRKGVYDHVAKHLRDGGQEPPEFASTPIVAAGHIIEIPNCPPAWWFQRPADVTPHGALTITDEGRVYGYLAPDGVAHRAFPGRRVTAPMGTVDYSRWMGGEAIVAGGGRVVAGPITMECGHMPPQAASSSVIRMEHYDNACSVVAKAVIGEDQHGVWIAGALEPGVTADQVSRMLACRLSGDWAPHPERPGWREFVAALIVPVPGFAEGRTAPSVRMVDGALVAAAVPVRLVHAGVDAAGPDLAPALERVARSIGRDRVSRLEALRARVHPGGR